MEKKKKSKSHIKKYMKKTWKGYLAASVVKPLTGKGKSQAKKKKERVTGRLGARKKTRGTANTT